MKKMILIVLLLLFAVPVLAFPGESIIKYLADKTGLTEQAWQWIGVTFILPALGWVFTKSQAAWDKWEKALYVVVFNGAKRLNLLIIGFPLLGVVWERFIEAFVIKWVTGVFRILAVIPIAIAAGFNSEGESLAGK